MGSRNPTTPRARDRTRLRGLFTDGAWHCDCDPRLPASRFETKNGGKNHGRWFYTCQKSQPKRCGFFLWQDDAKLREHAVLLNNTRSEAGAAAAGTSPPRPMTPPPAVRRQPNGLVVPRTEGDLDWSDSDAEEQMRRIADQASSPEKGPTTPRKEPRLEGQMSPGAARSASRVTPPPKRDYELTTPTTQRLGAATGPAPGLITPKETPAATRFQNALASPPPAFDITSPQRGLNSRPETDLATELLEQLKGMDIVLPEQAAVALRGTCERFARQTRLIEKGREVVRAMVKEKGVEITRLKEQVAELEAEREAQQTVINHLRKSLRE